MDRRDALRLLATGAALHLAPPKLFWMLREARSDLGGEAAPRTLNAHQFSTVNKMAELLLPRTETPGAADVGATEFIDLILTEWYDERERSCFLAGLGDVDSRAQGLFGHDFIGCSPAQQAEILIALGEQMTEEMERPKNQLPVDESQPELNFYFMLRRLTLTAYYTSETGATEELHFQIIPDRYDGCEAAQAGKGAPQRQ